MKTNKDRLLKQIVMGEVNHPTSGRGYRVDWDGKPYIGIGASGVKQNVTVGDLSYYLADGEHTEPGLSMTNKNPSAASALGVLTHIGNEAQLVSGDAKGAKGYVIGKHGAFMVWFPKEAQEKICPGDKIKVKAWGTGLQIKGYEEKVHVNKIDPILLEKLGVEEMDGKFHVPVSSDYPCFMMGSGYGMFPVTTDYDIQTTCDTVFDEYKLKDIRLGDIVAIYDQLNWWGRGYYKGAVTIGVVIHGWSYIAGHGPGVTTLLSSKDSTIVPYIKEGSNIAKYLGIK